MRGLLDEQGWLIVGRADLLDRQAALQAEADSIVELLDIENRLRAIGNPIRVGSSALGLMVRRDIDITVVCDKLDSPTHAAIAELLRELAAHPRVGSVRFRNDSGFWNKTPEAYPDGLYIGITCLSAADDEWTFDIWFVDEPARQPDLGHLETIGRRLTPHIRETILLIKTDLAASPPAQAEPLPSFLVYHAVLEHKVSNLAEFQSWLEQRS